MTITVALILLAAAFFLFAMREQLVDVLYEACAITLVLLSGVTLITMAIFGFIVATLRDAVRNFRPSSPPPSPPSPTTADLLNDYRNEK